MYKINLSSAIIFLLLHVGAVAGFSQKVYLFSDRTLYISGEQVLFSAFLSYDDSKQIEESQILYAEIISPDGKQQVGGKFQINASSAEGCLLIPEQNISGGYYLRAYTRSMRNQGPSSYAYKMIRIVNPLLNDVLKGNEDAVLVKDTALLDLSPGGFKLSTDKKEYATREKVNVNIMAINVPDLFESQVSVAVVPERSSAGYVIPSLSTEHSNETNRFFAETRGVSLTGEVKDRKSGLPITGARVNLSIIGQGRDFMATMSDTAGLFFFSLPSYTGSRDIFLCAEADSGLVPQLLVENDFCTVPVKLPSPAFKLSEEERATAFSMAQHTRIHQYFKMDTLRCVNKYETVEKSFYGQPSETIVFDDYVLLPTLEEYFNELPTSIRVRKKDGQKYFKVVGDKPEMAYFDPLVLVDWVAVNQLDKVIAASPGTIERIEIINIPYVKGDITYGGIISIISKRRDFAGIDLPSSGIFLNYQILADTCKCRIPETISVHQPDVRNTLYWNPDLTISADGTARFSFTTPDTPGKYSIIIKSFDGMQSKQHVSDFWVKKEE